MTHQSHNNLRLPANSRPMTHGSYDTMVQNQLGQQGFSVVRTVYDNLQYLHVLYNNLQNLLTLKDNLYVTENLTRYINEIVGVAHSLETLVNLNNNIGMLKELAPRVQSFSQELHTLNNESTALKKDAQEMLGRVDSALKSLNDLYIAYEQKLSLLLQQTENKLNHQYKQYHNELYKIYNHIIQYQKPINTVIQSQPIIFHLIASDAVNTALYTDKELDKAFAYEKILESEEFNNDERINRERLNYRPKGSAVLNILAKNEAKQIMQDESIKAIPAVVNHTHTHVYEESVLANDPTGE